MLGLDNIKGINSIINTLLLMGRYLTSHCTTKTRRVYLREMAYIFHNNLYTYLAPVMMKNLLNKN